MDRGESGVYRVVIAEDHPLLREGLKHEIGRSPLLKLVGEATGGEQLLNQISDWSPDIVVLDLSMPEPSGFTLVEELQNRHKDLKIMILSSFNQHEYHRKARQLGVPGFLSKEEPISVILEGIQKVGRGEKLYSKPYLPGGEERGIPLTGDGPPPELLTRREREILCLVAMGEKDEIIATSTGISRRTVEFHKTNIRSKLRLNSTAELVKYAIRHNLV